jgi:hypothetical protein
MWHDVIFDEFEKSSTPEFLFLELKVKLLLYELAKVVLFHSTRLHLKKSKDSLDYLLQFFAVVNHLPCGTIRNLL